MTTKFEEKMMVYQWLNDMCWKEKRVEMMSMLSQYRRNIDDLGFMLWHSYGCIAALLQEIKDMYTPTVSETLTPVQSYRACLALSLVQTIASHPNTKIPFLRSGMLMYLVPLLKTTSHLKPIEYVRISVLGVIGELLKNLTDTSIVYIFTTQLMPIVLRMIEFGSETCKAGSAYILNRIIENETGLGFICSTSDRATHVLFTLGKVVTQQTMEPSMRILRQIIGVYYRLSDNPSICDILAIHLPVQLCDGTFYVLLQQEQNTYKTLLNLISKVNYGLTKNPNNE